jgi:hypothetical protein
MSRARPPVSVLLVNFFAREIELRGYGGEPPLRQMRDRARARACSLTRGSSGGLEFALPRVESR